MGGKSTVGTTGYVTHWLLLAVIANCVVKKVVAQQSVETCYSPAVCATNGGSVTTWKQIYPSERECLPSGTNKQAKVGGCNSGSAKGCIKGDPGARGAKGEPGKSNDTIVKDMLKEAMELKTQIQITNSRMNEINSTLRKMAENVSLATKVDEFISSFTERISFLNQSLLSATIPERSLCSLGVATGGSVAASSITSSSEWNSQHRASYGRLNEQPVTGNVGSWSAKDNKTGEWIQVDFGTTKKVSAVMTQGRVSSTVWQWVTSYKVSCGDDVASLKSITDSSGNEVVFVGNSDQNSIVTQVFSPAVNCRYVRIYPQTFNNHMSLRMDWMTPCS